MFTGSIFYNGLFIFLLALPFVFTAVNIFFTLIAPEKMYRHPMEYIIGGLTIIVGTIYTAIYLLITDVRVFSDWSETLINSERHAPIFTESYPVIIVLAILAVLAYGALRVLPVYKIPPLVTVGLLSVVYIGIALNILWIIQTQPLGHSMSVHYESSYTEKLFSLEWFLVLFPINVILFGVKLIRYKIYEWNHPKKEKPEYKNRFLAVSGRILRKSEKWPIYAFLIMLPILGILLLILMLFGQRPDMIIRAWTETSGWTLSKMQSPPNLHVDEHYLCTVAAGGHKKLVKPKRMGVRHGHRIVVNRQLLIANAFEQILEERTPKFHRIVRDFYDKYGFPVARLIRTRVAADVVYILMKPAEWLFLFVLYLTDKEPENRISMQYITPLDERR